MSSDYLISVRGLHKYHSGIHVLKGIDFDVRAGEFISIIGRSGCGKTTFLRCLNCLEILDEGTIHIAGITLSRNRQEKAYISKFKIRAMHKKSNSQENDISLDEDFRAKVYALRLRVGMLFQSLNLFPHLTVLENITLAPVKVKNETKSQATLRAVQLLEKVGMGEFMERYPHQLSGGQAQRVAIARALAMSPQVMLYDEPTSALDPELVGEVIDVMKNLHREGMTQIIVTHSLNIARNASDRVAYMEDGKIIEYETTDKFFSSPKDQRTLNYLKLMID